MKRKKENEKQNLDNEAVQELKGTRKVKKNQKRKFQEDESLKELEDCGY